MTDSHECSGHSRHRELVESLTRQSAAMERLADLLPQLVAANMSLVAALTERDEQEPVTTYLDGSPLIADRAAGT
jgi:hypothetical protein